MVETICQFCGLVDCECPECAYCGSHGDPECDTNCGDTVDDKGRVIWPPSRRGTWRRVGETTPWDPCCGEPLLFVNHNHGTDDGPGIGLVLECAQCGGETTAVLRLRAEERVVLSGRDMRVLLSDMERET